MAIRVPQYTRPQVQTQGLRAPRQQPNAPMEAFGAGSSANFADSAIQGALQTAERIAAKEKEAADDVATTEALIEFTEIKNKFLYDTNEGAMLRQGKDAFGVTEEYGTKLNKEADRIAGGLHNETQKAIFASMRAKVGSEFNNTLTKHTFVEAKKFDDETVKSGLVTTRNDAVLNYQDPGKVRDSIGLQIALIENHAERHGIPEAAKRQMIDQEISRTHSSVISRMMNIGDDQRAKAYFDLVKDEIKDSEILLGVEKIVETGSLRGEAQRTVDSLMGEGLTLTQAREKIKEIDNPALRDEVNTRFLNEIDQAKKVKRVEVEEKFQDTVNMLDQTQGRGEIPIERWESFTLQEKKALEEWKGYLVSGKKPATDWEVYYDLKTQMPKEDFREVNLMEYRPRLADSEFKELVKMQKDVREGKTEEFDGSRTKAQVVDAVLVSIGINPKNKDAVPFRESVDQAIVQWQRDTGKKATNEDYRRVAEDIAIEGVLVDPDDGSPARSWFGWKKTRRLYETEPGRVIRTPDGDVMRPAYGITEVPRQDRAQIERALQRAGRRVSDQAVIDLYNQSLLRGLQ